MAASLSMKRSKELASAMTAYLSLTGPQIGELAYIVCELFTENDLEQLVRYKLDMDLFDEVAPGPLRDVADALDRSPEPPRSDRAVDPGHRRGTAQLPHAFVLQARGGFQAHRLE